MKAQITCTKIVRNGSQAIDVSGDRWIDLANAELFAEGTVLAILDLSSGTKYVTDFTYSGVEAVLEAAAGTGGFFALT